MAAAFIGEWFPSAIRVGAFPVAATHVRVEFVMTHRIVVALGVPPGPFVVVPVAVRLPVADGVRAVAIVVEPVPSGVADVIAAVTEVGRPVMPGVADLLTPTAPIVYRDRLGLTHVSSTTAPHCVAGPTRLSRGRLCRHEKQC